MSITWAPGPLGDAIEANRGTGVSFFDSDGRLLSVEFDDVDAKKDHQVLEFDRYRIEVSVRDGKISYSARETRTSKKRGRTAA